ncbi:hypothetical protein AAMO2058_000330200 [Amorphochlora amoebiformis]
MDPLKTSAYIMIVSGIVVFAVMVFGGIKPMYGRYGGKSSAIFFEMNGKVAWVLQELPMVLWGLFALITANRLYLSSPANVILTLFLLTHYLQRTFVFPFLIRGGKTTPFVIFLCALAFCAWNGYVQNTWLMKGHLYPSNWIYDLRFLTGMLLAVIGMAINLHADHVLRNLRKPGETGYKIPHGGMFEYVSGANFFGEILEWTGFAIAQWSLVGFAFAFFTFSNIGPRGSYLRKFDDYPKNRRAVIPFLW